MGADVIDIPCSFVTLIPIQQEELMAEEMVCTSGREMVPGNTCISLVERKGVGSVRWLMLSVFTGTCADHVIENMN